MMLLSSQTQGQGQAELARAEMLCGALSMGCNPIKVFLQELFFAGSVGGSDS